MDGFGALLSKENALAMQISASPAKVTSMLSEFSDSGAHLRRTRQREFSACCRDQRIACSRPWPNQDPLGHTIEFWNMDGDLRLLTIVGIVGDIHEYGLDVPPRPTVYVNLFQRPRPAITLTMLSDADTRFGHIAARGILTGSHPEIPARFRTFSQVYLLRWARGDSMSFSPDSSESLRCFLRRPACWSDGLFRQPPHPRNWRACRARRGFQRCLEDDSEPGLRTIFVGVAIGIAGSLALTRAVESRCFGVTATDP